MRAGPRSLVVGGFMAVLSWSCRRRRRYERGGRPTSSRSRIRAPTRRRSGLRPSDEATRGRLEYVHRVSTRSWARRHWVDALIVLVAVATASGGAVHDGAASARTVTLWFSVPAAAALVLALLWRRRFAFAAPVAVFLLGAAISFVDGRIVVTAPGSTAAGVAAAVLLGNLRDARQARLGLAVALRGAATLVFK